MPATELNSAIYKLYRAGLEPDHWAAALQAVSDVVDGCAAVMEFTQTGDPNAQVQVTSSVGYDPHALTSILGTNLAEFDPWLPCIEQEPDSTLHIGSKYVPAAAVRQSLFYNEGLRATGLDWRDVMAIVRPLSNGTTAILAVYRNGQRDDFSFADMARMQTLQPHIAQALDIAARMQGQDLRLALNDEIGSRRNDAVLFLDTDGAVVHANTRAESLCTAAPPVLSLRGGRPHIQHNARADRQLQAALEKGTGCVDGQATPTTGAIVWSSQHRSAPYSACLIPYLRQAFPDTWIAARKRPVVAMVIRDFSSNAAETAARARQAYGLTRAEARILELLIAGTTVASICDQTRVSPNTVKTQLKALYRKTGTHSQTELVRQVLLGFHI